MGLAMKMQVYADCHPEAGPKALFQKPCRGLPNHICSVDVEFFHPIIIFHNAICRIDEARFLDQPPFLSVRGPPFAS